MRPIMLSEWASHCHLVVYLRSRVCRGSQVVDSNRFQISLFSTVWCDSYWNQRRKWRARKLKQWKWRAQICLVNGCMKSGQSRKISEPDTSRITLQHQLPPMCCTAHTQFRTPRTSRTDHWKKHETFEDRIEKGTSRHSETSCRSFHACCETFSNHVQV